MTLLVFIYIIYIGLGIPDSMLGAAWPAIYRALDLPVSMAGYVTMTVSCLTVVSSLISARLLNRFGVGKVTLVSVATTALCLLGYSFSGHPAAFFLLAIPMGLGAGAIDAGLNNFVALHYSAKQMNFLHCFYGIGVFISPYVIAWALARSDWRAGYRGVACLQLVITLAALIALPRWQKAAAAPEAAIRPKTLTLAEMFKMSSARATWLMFFLSDSILFLCGTWGCTWLVDSCNFSLDAAARTAAFFYLGLALGRFLSGLLAVKLSCWRLIQLGAALACAGIAMLFLPSIAPTGLFAVGAGVSPFYPCLTHLTPRHFGADVSQSMMGTQQAACYTGIMLNPMVFGILAENVGASLFPWYLTGLFAALLLSMLFLVRALRRQGRYNAAGNKVGI